MKNKKVPANVWRLRDLHDHMQNGPRACINQAWVPAKPVVYPSLRWRLTAAWGVLTGRYSAFLWPEDDDAYAVGTSVLPGIGQVWKSKRIGELVRIVASSAIGVSYATLGGRPLGTRSTRGFLKNYTFVS